jgi:hypothetical protein
MGFYADVHRFALEHRGHGQPVFDAEDPTAADYRLWIQCPCGVRFDRLVTPEEADADLL